MFDGKTYDPALDHNRLNKQLGRVWSIMSYESWHTLDYLVQHAGGTTASVSARLRDLRKEKFGGYKVNRRRISGGLFEYQLEVKK